MMLKVRPIFLIFLLGINLGYAQDYMFKVMASKGDNRFKRASQTDWKPVKIGISFNKGDKLMTSKDPYIGLLHSSGQTMELSEQGTFEIEQLASKVGIKKKGISAKYAEFVLNELENKDNNQLRVSIESRGLGEEIYLFLPLTAMILNPSLVIHWSRLRGERTYVLSVKNMFGDPLIQLETNSNQLTLDLDQEELSTEKLLIISVSLKDDPSVVSNDIGLERLTGDKVDALKQEIAQLNEEIDSDSPLGQVILASYYEAQDLLIDAIYHYQEAIKLAPDVPDFETMYHAFLIRNNLHE